MAIEQKAFSSLKESFDKTHEIELKAKALCNGFGNHFEELNDSYSMDVDSDDTDGTISVSTATINKEKDVVLIEVNGFSLDEDSSHAVLLSKDNCIKLIRALSTAASLLR